MLAELIGETPNLEHTHHRDQRQQHEGGTADDERQNTPIGLRREDHRANCDDRCCQREAGETDLEIAGVNGHEGVVSESRQLISRDRLVAERIGHACFLATD